MVSWSGGARGQRLPSRDVLAQATHAQLITCMYVAGKAWVRVPRLHVAEGYAPSLILGAHAQKGYSTSLVCVSVCYHSSGNIGRFYTVNEVCRGLSGFSRVLTRGFSINPSIQKLW